MAKVLGIGGIFFKAADPKALGDWYQRVLGFPISDWGGAIFPHPAQGVTLWSPFKADTGYFAPLAARLHGQSDRRRPRRGARTGEGRGVDPIGRQEESEGRFAWILDPAGVKVELWQPLGEAAAA
ncbi:MAG: hypothetical protein WDN03_06570 [Rhizomicrobium sp.]